MVRRVWWMTVWAGLGGLGVGVWDTSCVKPLEQGSQTGGVSQAGTECPSVCPEPDPEPDPDPDPAPDPDPGVDPDLPEEQTASCSGWCTHGECGRKVTVKAACGAQPVVWHQQNYDIYGWRDWLPWMERGKHEFHAMAGEVWINQVQATQFTTVTEIGVPLNTCAVFYYWTGAAGSVRVGEACNLPDAPIPMPDVTVYVGEHVVIDGMSWVSNVPAGWCPCEDGDSEACLQGGQGRTRASDYCASPKDPNTGACESDAQHPDLEVVLKRESYDVGW